MPASSSAVSAASNTTSGWRRLDTAALIAASGVRRSWLTPASRAVRSALLSAARRARPASRCSRRASSTVDACAANASSSRRSRARSGRSGADRATRAMSSPTGTRMSPSSGRSHGRSPTEARTDQSSSRPPCPVSPAVVPLPVPRSSTVTDVVPKVSATWCSSASRASRLRIIVEVITASARASASLSAASWLRRAAASTTQATAAPRPTDTSTATPTGQLLTARLPRGSVKNTSTSTPPATAHSSAGRNPPTRATTTVAARYSIRCSDRSTGAAPDPRAAVSAAGRASAAIQATVRRRVPSGELRRVRRPGQGRTDLLSTWVTTCTSMSPDPSMTASPTPRVSRAASRERREMPITTWVALTPRAKVRIAAATSSPVTVEKVPPSDSTRCRWRTRSAGELPAMPSPRAT